MSIEEARQQAGIPVKECIQCGNCCKKINLNLILPDKIREMLGMHFNRPVDSLALTMQHQCAQLEEIEPGKYKCKVYDNRPELCERFICDYMAGREYSRYVEVRVDNNNIT